MIAALALLLLAAPGEDIPDLIGPAAQGKLQCYMPNRERRTCLSLTGYRPDGKGGFLSTAEILVAAKPLVTMRMSAPIVIRGSEICGPLRRDSYDQAEFLAEDRPLDAEKAAQLRAMYVEASAGMFDREICTKFTVSGDHLVAHTVLGGGADDVTMDVIWVAPEEGYRVAS